jgi:hypothetical protein
MPYIKRVIVRVSVFLLMFLLLAAVLSKTVYRLLLPQVSEAPVLSSGSLDNRLMFRAVVGMPVDEAGGENDQNGGASASTEAEYLKYAVDLNLSFSEIQMICAQGTSTSAMAEMVYNPSGTPVDIWISGYDYDSVTDRYILHFHIRCPDEAIETGSVLTITASQKYYLNPYFVPLNGVYNELVSGVPQYYVYALVVRQTMWGKDTYIQKRIVTLGGSDYQAAQVTFDGEAPKRIACYPSRTLNDGDAVRVLIES